MFSTALAAVVSFISTNLDDIFILMLFFAQEEQPGLKRRIVLGQYLGMGVLTAASLTCARLLQMIPQQFIGLLGVVPIALGVREWIGYVRERGKAEAAGVFEEAEDVRGCDASGECISENVSERGARSLEGPCGDSRANEHGGSDRGLTLSVMLLAIANGADNLGVYIPLFTGFGPVQMLIVLIVFAAMIGLWCLLARRIASLPALNAALRKYRHVIVPAVFIALGIYIIGTAWL